MTRLSAVLLSTTAFVLLKGDGCGDGVTTRVKCEGAVAKMDLLPNYCAQVPNCLDPARQIYDSSYSVTLSREMRLLSPTVSATVTPSAWMLVTFALVDGAQDAAPLVRAADSLRVCATAVPPVRVSTTEIQFEITASDGRAAPQVVEVTVGEHLPFAAEIVPEEDPTKVDVIGARTYIAHGVDVRFDLRVSGGVPWGARVTRWSSPNPEVTILVSEDTYATVRTSGHCLASIELRATVVDGNGVQHDVSWTGGAGKGCGVVWIEGPRSVYPGSQYTWAAKHNATFDTDEPRSPPGTWAVRRPDGAREQVTGAGTYSGTLGIPGMWTIEYQLEELSSSLGVLSTY